MGLLRNLYDNIEEYLCVSALFIMIVCLSLQVFMRILSGSALDWTEELSRYSFIWAVYIGSVLAAKKFQHVRVTAQFMFFSPPVKLFLRILIDAVWVAFNLVFAYYSYFIVADGLLFPEDSPTMPFLIKAYVEMIIPIAFVFMSWRIIEGYYKLWRAGELYNLVKYEEEAQ
ncbi:TRAP transporter small permease [Desulfovibrio litoralis]|uniref:TRAP-type C4-dicarboxylate transport system, small permease component n=1 Tax=Desulfovibrio litoralis DSM 11393 TaxID=1121455 RepID=A0A1M7T3Y2_9BACT|nr:TRAP transporter small permease [Desulfovibrio litoralis]SHN65372.1 TRAP-type C4-dicarboxylate transport system, small permease component [Desulfovibrio litoralis DSM 11393]